jgi:hypothetical protein
VAEASSGPEIKAPILKVSRDVRADPGPGMPWPETREFRVDARAGYKGGVVLSWTSGTKKRGNSWEMRLSLDDLNRLMALATSVRIRALEHESGMSVLEAQCWRELFRTAAPEEVQAREEEIVTFLREGPTRKSSGKPVPGIRRAKKR